MNGVQTTVGNRPRSVPQGVSVANSADGLCYKGLHPKLGPGSCKECQRARAAAWAKANPEKKRKAAQRYREANRGKSREYQQRWYSANPERAVAWRAANPDKRTTYDLRSRLARHGLTIDDYEAIKAAQDNRCVICGKRSVKRRLSIDHDHETGRVRGLLCLRCNRHLGGFEFSLEVLERLIRYVRAIITDRQSFDVDRIVPSN